MKLEDIAKMDFAKMSPQQRSHLRKRLERAGVPIPDGLASKRGSVSIVTEDPAPSGTDDPAEYDCTVVESSGVVRTYHISPDNM